MRIVRCAYAASQPASQSRQAVKAGRIGLSTVLYLGMQRVLWAWGALLGWREGSSARGARRHGRETTWVVQCGVAQTVDKPPSQISLVWRLECD
jgi:hypothetical protein